MSYKLPDDVLGIECKFVSYVEAIDGSKNDMLLIKELIHYKNGKKVPNVRLKFNHKRPYWITKPNLSNGVGPRNHKDKKEWELIENLNQFESTQIELADNIFRSLKGMPPGRKMNLREVCASPYVYGADVTSPVLVKRAYMDKYPQCNADNSTPFVVAGLDIETDTVKGTEDIIMLSVVLLDKVRIIISEDFIPKTGDVHAELDAMTRKMLMGKVNFLEVDLQIEWAPSAAHVAYRGIQTLHEWTPDIVEVWNIDFDLPKIQATLERAGYDLGEVFADPKVPEIFRKFHYKQGPSQKVTQSGKSMPLPPFDRWHDIFHAGSFVFLDGMCVYRKLRVAKGMSPVGYGLDAILKTNGLGGKLGIGGTKSTGLQWHTYMQTHKKLEYCIYNIWDSYSMVKQDQITGDLNRQIGLHSGHSEFHRFPSQPRRTWDDMHFFALKHGKVAATTAKDMTTEFDKNVISLKGHIVTLPSHQVHAEGARIIEEIPDYSTYLYTHVFDLDIEGTYPNYTVAANISRETTVTEVVAIEGIDDKTMRSIGVNFTSGHTNAVEFCTRVYKAPSLETLLADFRAHRDGVESTFVDEGWEDASGDELEEDESEYSYID